MNPVIEDVLLILAKWGLSVLTTYLVAHHIASADAADAFRKDVAAHLVLWVPAVGGLILMLWGKIRARKRLMTALTMPIGSTENDVKAVLKSGVITPTIFTPPNTVPGVPTP